MTIASPADLLASYRQVPGAYDEMVAADGRIRDHWAHAGSGPGPTSASTSCSTGGPRPAACSTTTG